MKVSVCITIHNEEESIAALLSSLLTQTQKPDEIIIVDSASIDKTTEIIKHFQKKDKRIKLLIEKCSRAKGRNIGVELAKNRIIAITDAGCIPKKDWLERISNPFENNKVEMVAGFYKMIGNAPFQKALAHFLGITPSRFDTNFLPSARSIAFRKNLWEKVGGFNERLEEAGEDTDFNHKVLKHGAVIVRLKSAVVEWGIPSNIHNAFKKFFIYAKGDARTKTWRHASKNQLSHNIKILFIYTRYVLGIILLILGFSNSLYWQLLFLGFFVYIIWAFLKVYREAKNIRVGIWGIIIQFISDIAVMSGFLYGLR